MPSTGAEISPEMLDRARRQLELASELDDTEPEARKN
jgi:hypothetical protein